jgi:2-polyprenyl-3-methyl-5-hydroxy-6-metoxy-1,4-benzoquinol methylase
MSKEIKIDYDNINVEDIMRQIKKNIASRNYKEADLEQLQSTFGFTMHLQNFDWSRLKDNIGLTNLKHRVNTTVPLISTRKRLGRFVELVKKVLRRMTFWYVNFVFEQQNDFNSSVTRSLNDIEKYLQLNEERLKIFETEIKNEIVQRYKDTSLKQEVLIDIQNELRSNKEKMETIENQIANYGTELHDLAMQMNSITSEALLKIQQEMDDLRLQTRNDYIETIEKLNGTNQVEINEFRTSLTNIQMNVESISSAFLENKHSQMEFTSNMVEQNSKIQMDLDQQRNKLTMIHNMISEYGRIMEVSTLRLKKIEKLTSIKKEETIEIVNKIQNSDVEMDYFLFEAKYRGSRSEIMDRQRQYLTFFLNKKNVLDIGCGRGEFVELLLQNNVDVKGIDILEDNVFYCSERGLPVTLGDALNCLTNVEDHSLGGIFMAQVIEHLNISDQIAFVKLAYKKLQPGAYLIVETINPQALIVYVESFYMDPTHTKPVHPLTLKFWIDAEGFQSVEFIYSSPVSEEFKIPKLNDVQDQNINQFNNAISRLNDIVYGNRDYAIVARK